jgi:hypothetical protein
VHWKIASLWGGKKVELRETQRAVTPFGGLVVFFEFLRRIAYSEAVRQHLPFSLRSPNAIDPVENFHGVFTLGRCWSAALRTHQFATRRQGPCTRCRESRVFPSTTRFATCSSASGKGSASDFSLACGTGSSNDCRKAPRRLHRVRALWTPARCLAGPQPAHPAEKVLAYGASTSPKLSSITQLQQPHSP